MYFDEKNYVKLGEYIKTEDRFYAHRPRTPKEEDKGQNEGQSKIQDIEDNLKMKEKETLEEHLGKCINYFHEIVEHKNLTPIFAAIEKNSIGGFSEEAKILYRSMIQNSILFHDMGKINPVFQSIKMGEPLSDQLQCINGVGTDSYHSPLSAILYIDYFRPYVQKLEKKERKKIRYFLYINAYLIYKHHSSLSTFEDFLSQESKLRELMKELNGKEFPFVQRVLKFQLGEDKTDQKRIRDFWDESIEKENITNLSTSFYTYARLLYSLLVASDYYATSEYMNEVKIKDFGNLKDIKDFQEGYTKTKRYQGIREYEQNVFKKRTAQKDTELHMEDINQLRNEIFLETEAELLDNLDRHLYFLEAPTGSGKSNIAMNLSYRLMEKDPGLNKIFWVYPFNTLVEQNINTLKDIYGENSGLLHKVATINSITPIKSSQSSAKSEKPNDDVSNEELYTKDLLNHQFLNYPFILTTSVSLFKTMFGEEQSDLFAYHQLCNSVIVLDEIQSYKNTIWAEIIIFLKAYAKLLNIRVIIMSATLPRLDIFLEDKESIVNLVKNREKYFCHPMFCNRVNAHYELLESEDVMEELQNMVVKDSEDNKRVVVEFITKKRAAEFFDRLYEEKENGNISVPLRYMTGDSNAIERNDILMEIQEAKEQKSGIILVATQVIEAGVDIDMNVGYKDCSKLDSEEQFMGRINRSCFQLNSGDVYFFNLDNAAKIYRNDVRVDKKFTILNPEIRKILDNKDYVKFYKGIIEQIKTNFNESLNDDNLRNFYEESVLKLDFTLISNRMKLISDEAEKQSVFLNREIEDKKNNKVIKGHEVWKRYKDLIKDQELGYAEKMVLLSQVRSEMNYFVYEIGSVVNVERSDRIGELYYVEDGDKYFINEILDRKRLEEGRLDIGGW